MEISTFRTHDLLVMGFLCLDFNMNKQDIIRMARMAGIDSVQQYDSDTSPIVLLERFAALVASAEREACAKLCEQGLAIATSLSALDDMEMWGEKFAAAIRARGQA